MGACKPMTTKTQVKHTPGPWSVIFNDHGNSVESVRTKDHTNNDMMGDYKGCIIASFNNAHGNRKHAFDEARANALLIAAAPELLEACKFSLESGDDLEAIRKLKAAINKAEGKTEGESK